MFDNINLLIEILTFVCQILTIIVKYQCLGFEA
jgi:hypothetical protein